MEIETDWIKNFEESERNYNIFYKSQLKKVKLYSIYVNPQCVIEKIKQQPVNLNTNILTITILNIILNILLILLPLFLHYLYYNY